jgi:hypothetical protein
MSEEVPNPFAEEEIKVETDNSDESSIVVEVEPTTREEDTNIATEPETTETNESDIVTNAKFESFSEELWEILEQAGISRKAFMIFVSIIIGIILLAIVYLIWPSGSESDSAPTVKAPTETVVEEEPNTENVAISDPNAAISIAYIAGKNFSPIEATPISAFGSDSGLDTALKIGTNNQEAKEEASQITQLLFKMQNIYETDVYELLNKSTNRRGKLAEHLKEFGDLIVEGEKISNSLDKQIAFLNEEANSLEITKNELENLYFLSAENLEGQKANEALNNFVEISKKLVETKALLSSKIHFNQMLDNSLVFLKPRYQDISLNKEAVIKGIKVFDVPESDIRAIITQ